MTKKEGIRIIQGCINTYEGKHGKIKKITDTWEKFEVNENIEYYIGMKEGTMYIFLRGSDEWKDWAQNLDTNSIDIDDGQMHLGFFEDNKRIEDHCYLAMKGVQKIVIAGHSKGAAQALILTYFAQKKFPGKDIYCVAVASPKCMSKKLIARVKNTVVIINGEDYVTKIPFWKFNHPNIIRIGKRNLFFMIPFIRMAGAWVYHWPQKYLEEWLKIVDK